MKRAQLPVAIAIAAMAQMTPASAAPWLLHEVGIVNGHYVDSPVHAQAPYLGDMLEKNVIGSGGEFLGRVVAVDAAENRVEVQLPSGVRIPLDGRGLVDTQNAVRAPDISDSDMQRLAQLQMGRAVASQ